MIEVADIKIVKKRFDKSVETYNKQAIVQKKIAKRLSRLIQITEKNSFDNILEIGCGTGFLTKEILTKNKVSKYFLNDLAVSSFKEIKEIAAKLNFRNYRLLSGDAEKIDFPNSIDAVISSSSFQWFKGFDLFLDKINKLLNDKGLIAFSTFGKENFREIKFTLNVGLNYKTLEELKASVSGKFEIIYAEEWTEQLQFNNAASVLKHMKQTGVNSLTTSYFGKNKFLKFEKEYTRLFSNKNNTVNLTYHPIIIIARKKTTKA